MWEGVSTVTGYVTVHRCLDPLLCRPMTGRMKINPSNRLALYTQCVDDSCSPPTALSYQWTLYRRGLNGAWLPINDCENYTTGPLYSVLPLTQNYHMIIADVSRHSMSYTASLVHSTLTNESSRVKWSQVMQWRHHLALTSPALCFVDLSSALIQLCGRSGFRCGAVTVQDTELVDWMSNYMVVSNDLEWPHIL